MIKHLTDEEKINMIMAGLYETMAIIVSDTNIAELSIRRCKTILDFYKKHGVFVNIEGHFK